MNIPNSLDWLRSKKSGRQWLNHLPELLNDCLVDWELTIDGPPMNGGNVSYVQPVRRGNDKFILKIQWPHHESDHEAAALKAWNGIGAIKLYKHHAERHALLIERCDPGQFLAHGKCDPIGVFTGMLPRLWVKPDYEFHRLETEADRWRKDIHVAMVAHREGEFAEMCEKVLELSEDLTHNQGEQVLLHQDLHGHNVLSAEREPWLVIDPKPLLGEREFSLAPIVRSFELGHNHQQTLDRLDLLSQTLHLDRERVRRWTLLQTLAWSFGSELQHIHMQTVRWLLDA